MAKKRKSPAGVIQPECLYSRRAFLEATGISANRLRDARRRGVEPPWLTVGKRKFLFGSAAIQYIVSLSELERPRLCDEMSHQIEQLIPRGEARCERTRIFGLGVV